MNSKNNKDDLATLLRTAGTRTAVPEERMQRVKSATRTVWREQVVLEARRKQKRTYWAFGGLAAAAMLTLVFLIIPRGPVSSGAILESSAGHLNIGALVAQRGESIPLGVDISTRDTSGAAITMSNGHSLRLDAETIIRLETTSSISLRQGALYVSSGERAGAAGPGSTPITVTVGDIEIREIGTQFEVRVDDALHPLRVRVREGRVRVLRDTIEQEVQAGTEFSLDAAGVASTQPVVASDHSWDWTVQLAPMLGPEGRTASTMLRWIARERGWQLVYSDTLAEQQADSAAVEGDLEGLSFEQALDIVMASCELEYRVEAGMLRVEASR